MNRRKKKLKEQKRLHLKRKRFETCSDRVGFHASTLKGEGVVERKKGGEVHQRDYLKVRRRVMSHWARSLQQRCDDAVWFSNRRARWRKQMGSQNYNTYGSLSFNYQHPSSYLVSTRHHTLHIQIHLLLQTGSTGSLHHHHHHLHTNPTDARSSLAYNTVVDCSSALQPSV
ncbi:hypothetical protein CEXT_204401, partial [Caerostris extrusa]